ncbi:MAG TPA: SemiSWEET transporter [Ohtaekwangia sp.]|uniref:SemiSWEET family sugar transporter n=1 Tax=Ohtaekwangia sp. TaxID=2066019 RepID=UPI002F9343D2
MSTEVIGIVAGTCTALSLLPQLVKIIQKKEARDISLFYLIVLLAGLSLWVWYGILRKDIPIIATNVTSTILNIAIIILGIRYKK